MYNPAAVANVLIQSARAKQQSLDPLQVMKLTCIAHGWHLALHDSPLINREVQAWKYGPVIPALYPKIRKYGGGPVSELLPVFSISGGEVSDSDKTFIGGVYDSYGSLSGIALSNLTHRTGTPWFQVYKEGQNVPIPDDLTGAYYKALAVEAQSQTDSTQGARCG